MSTTVPSAILLKINSFCTKQINIHLSHACQTSSPAQRHIAGRWTLQQSTGLSSGPVLWSVFSGNCEFFWQTETSLELVDPLAHLSFKLQFSLVKPIIWHFAQTEFGLSTIMIPLWGNLDLFMQHWRGFTRSNFFCTWMFNEVMKMTWPRWPSLSREIIPIQLENPSHHRPEIIWSVYSRKSVLLF